MSRSTLMPIPLTVLLTSLALWIPMSVVTGSSAAGPAPAPPATPVEPADEEPGEAGLAMQRELRALERAWADGGGTWGYPFWEKAGQRWRTGEITGAMYREYVTGYRDRLVVGCTLLERVEAGTETSEAVRELLIDACERRVDALRAQQRSLDEQVALHREEAEVDAAARQARVAELDAEATEALQESWRSTRIAMNQSQAALDAAGLDRLAEDAFI